MRERESIGHDDADDADDAEEWKKEWNGGCFHILIIIYEIRCV
jgi:hypothetical protein